MVKGLEATKKQYGSDCPSAEVTSVLAYLQAVDTVKHSTDAQLASRLIEQFQLAREHIPTHYINSKEVCMALFLTPPSPRGKISSLICFTLCPLQSLRCKFVIFTIMSFLQFIYYYQLRDVHAPYHLIFIYFVLPNELLLRYSEFCSTSSLPLGNEVCEGYVLHVSVHRGHAWQGGMHGWGGMCMVGGLVWQGSMHGEGACMAGGPAWQRGACMGGHACHGRYYGIRSMSRRYASYWNAFLLIDIMCNLNVKI